MKSFRNDNFKNEFQTPGLVVFHLEPVDYLKCVKQQKSIYNKECRMANIASNSLNNETTLTQILQHSWTNLFKHMRRNKNAGKGRNNICCKFKNSRNLETLTEVPEAVNIANINKLELLLPFPG